MYENSKLSVEEQQSIRMQILRMNKKPVEEIFSNEFRENNKEAFEQFFLKNYKLEYNEVVQMNALHPPTMLLYYSAAKNDARIVTLGQYESIHEIEIADLQFRTIDEIKAGIYQENSKYYDKTYQNIIDKYEELSVKSKSSLKIK